MAGGYQSADSIIMVVNEMIHKRFFLICLWGSLAVLATFYEIMAVWQINQWSLAYLDKRLDPDSVQSELSDPPENHPFARIWLAEEALEIGEVEKAQMQINLIIAKDKTLTQRARGNFNWRSGNVQSALQVWNDINDYQSVLKAARQAHDSGQLDLAAQAYEVAILIKPEQSILEYANFLWYHYDSQEKAKDLVKKAIEEFPGSNSQPIWLQKLGDFLVIQERWDEAEVVYLTLLHEASYDWQAHISLGWLYYQRGDGPEIAFKEFEKSISLAPNRGDGYLAIARLLADQKRYKDADAWFRQALSHNPNMPWWYIWRGNAARENGNLDLATQIYLDAINRFPDWARSYYDLARAYYLVGDLENSKKSIENALELMSPAIPEYVVLAGQIAETCGEYDNALKKYKYALSIDPNNSSAEQAIQRIQNEIRAGR